LHYTLQIEGLFVYLPTIGKGFFRVLSLIEEETTFMLSTAFEVVLGAV